MNIINGKLVRLVDIRHFKNGSWIPQYETVKEEDSQNKQITKEKKE